MQDTHLHALALVQNLAESIPVDHADLRDMDQPIQPLFETGKSPELHNTGNRGFQDLARIIASFSSLPRIGMQPFQAEGHPCSFAIDVEHQRFQPVTYTSHVRRMMDPSPGQLRNMDEPFNPAQIDKHAEIGNIRHLAVNVLARLQVVEQAGYGSHPQPARRAARTQFAHEKRRTRLP